MIWEIHIDDSTFTSRRESLDIYMYVLDYIFMCE